MGYERITADKRFDGAVRASHEWRYYWARAFVRSTDTVIDAACGTGYGGDILAGGKYIGVDRELHGEWNTPKLFIPADLETWQPDFPFDVFVSIETIEHLSDKGVENLLAIAAKAKKYAVISTPIIPTKHRNEFHRQDFTPEQVKNFLPNRMAFDKQDAPDGTKDVYGIAAFRTS